ncbi:MAG: 4Fe-4S binding protein [Desulfatitalea sp.]|nr:4Fe-4S binding protein [Desulfatitalea sp.]NNK00812.1 4Fe-4S binding protein [Desulfatitalea sp.]
MDHNVYEQLADVLDTRGVGFPRTTSGVEFKILKMLFTAKEADLYMKLSLEPEPLQVIAQKLGQDADALAAALNTMAEKGLIIQVPHDGMVLYMAIPFAIGILEGNAIRVKEDPVFANLVTQYLDEGLGAVAAKPPLALRPVPVNRAITVSWPIATHDDLREIVRTKQFIAVTDCLCRTRKVHAEDKSCGKPTEVCITFDLHAHMAISRAQGRQITAQEAIDILDKAEAAGLVPMAFNSINPSGVCNCCGDCCGVLQYVAKNSKPAKIVLSNYFAVVDKAQCVGCEVCLDRCQMTAIAMNADNIAQVNLDRCIGCGLCITSCDAGALSLALKPETERQVPVEAAP